jgi:hypothetical protein
MLVMTTLFLNTSSSLPRTSYFKMIDIWMVFGLLLPFLEIVLHTLTEYRYALWVGEGRLGPEPGRCQSGECTWNAA